MDENNELTLSEPNNNNSFLTLHEQFQRAMIAFMMRDSLNSEQALFKAQSLRKNILATEDQDYINYFNIVLSFMQVLAQVLKAQLFASDERYRKALEALKAAQLIYDEVDKFFNLFSAEAIEDLDEDGTISMLKFLMIYFEQIIDVSNLTFKSTLEMNDGIFVDEVEMNRKAAAELRKVNYQDLNIANEEVYNMVSAFVSLLTRIADTYEKKAERLEEKRKVIEFVRPIDKKIFIVHGHNEGALRELKEILEDNFKLNPIVLRDESDDGNTVIEKFERFGRLCAFAFVIVTPDDLIKDKKAKYFQARPNVLFELGWFCGRYGRSKVRILRQRNTPLPSDLGGLVSHDFDIKIKEVYLDIQADLINAGILSNPELIVPI